MVRILGFARAVGHHRAIAGLVRHIHRFDGLAQRADLIHRYKDRIGDVPLDALPEPRGVGDEQIIANQLAARRQDR